MIGLAELLAYVYLGAHAWRHSSDVTDVVTEKIRQWAVATDDVSMLLNDSQNNENQVYTVDECL